MTDRTARLAKHIQELNDAGLRSNMFYDLAYASLRTTKERPVQERRALAQAYILDHAPLEIHKGELLIGSMTGMCPCIPELDPHEAEKQARAILDKYVKERSAAEAPERNSVKTFEQEFQTKKSRWSLMSRVYHDGSVSYASLQKLISELSGEYRDKGLEHFEVGRELERGMKLSFAPGVREEIDSLPWFAANHLALNYGRIANVGIGSLQDTINQRLAEDDLTEEERSYYECALIVSAAMEQFVLRYAEKAKEKALAEEDPERARELRGIEEICRAVSSRGAKSFREALQIVWLCHIMASFLGSSALSFGRFDQYMQPFYEEDLARGRINREEALELIEHFWLKINEPKLRTVQSLTLGGVDANGNDAANDITELCLEAAAELALPYPNVGLRVHENTDPALYEMAVHAVQAGSGQPMLLNDRIWIPNLVKLGYTVQQARNYYNMGCVEIMLPNEQPNWGVTDPVAFPMLFEEVFSRVREQPEDFGSFEDFFAAYADVLKKAVEADRTEADSKIAQFPGRCYDPFASLLIDGCLDTGRDMFQGGSRLGIHWSFYAYGLGTAADAMAAVKKHVYDEGSLSISELGTVLRENFQGHEPLRRQLLEETPHFGNDEEEADSLAARILDIYTSMVVDMNDPGASHKYVSTLFGYFFHVYHGEITGATPDGRLRGEPLSDSMGPAQGRDVHGPTALLNSALRLHHGAVTGGYALNFKVSPGICETAAGTRALQSLFKAYMDDGGPQLQAYVVRADDLRDAMMHPEKHRNLIVRVGGYCEYFVHLDAKLQEEIVRRTEFGS